MTASDRTGMLEIKIEFLFTLALEVEVLDLGNTPYGSRRVGRFGEGNFEGPKLKGTGVAGWLLLDAHAPRRCVGDRGPDHPRDR